MNNLQTILLTAAATVLGQIASFLPRLLGAILIFSLGLLLAGWAKRLTTKIITTSSLNKLLRHTAVEKFLRQAELPHAFEEALGQLVKWVIILIFFIATTNTLGLTAVTEMLRAILAYIPNVLGAILVLAVGILLAGFLESVVKGSLAGFDGKLSRLLGKITSYTIVVFAILAALSQLRIAEQFIHTLFSGVVAALALGVGLAIGLGAKDTVNTLLKKWYRQLK